MNRRSFLKALLGTAAASTTTYFLPPVNGWTSDVIAHPKQIGWGFDGSYVYEDPFAPGEVIFILPKPGRYPIEVDYSYWKAVNVKGVPIQNPGANWKLEGFKS